MTQHTATHCNTLQLTATHCNTLQHTMGPYHWLHIITQHLYSLLHLECRPFPNSNLNLIGLFSMRGKRDLENKSKSLLLYIYIYMCVCIGKRDSCSCSLENISNDWDLRLQTWHSTCTRPHKIIYIYIYIYIYLSLITYVYTYIHVYVFISLSLKCLVTLHVPEAA